MCVIQTETVIFTAGNDFFFVVDVILTVLCAAHVAHSEDVSSRAVNGLLWH